MNSPASDRPFVAFAGPALVVRGDLAAVATAVKAIADAEHTDHPAVHVFDAETSEPLDLDLRGSLADVLARLAPAAPSAPRAPGRPKLGVVAREVTLLPRHWEWLAEQPGGASVTLRKLVEGARRESSSAGQRLRAQDSAYRFMVAVAGNEAGFEEAARALYAGDAASFAERTDSWPADVRDHTRALAAAVFSAGQ